VTQDTSNDASDIRIRSREEVLFLAQRIDIPPCQSTRGLDEVHEIFGTPGCDERCIDLRVVSNSGGDIGDVQRELVTNSDSMSIALQLLDVVAGQYGRFALWLSMGVSNGVWLVEIV
jgi:hypothetical protein